MAREKTVYELVGGSQFFVDLVDRFYDGVATDPVLRPLYPSDLGESRRFLAGFLIQYWGGPTDYSDERGHPRLRMRHIPFPIGPAERDAWLRHMLGALDADPHESAVHAAMVEYFVRTADFLVNTEPLSLRPTEGGPHGRPDHTEGHGSEQ
jgi:hemoglobin